MVLLRLISVTLGPLGQSLIESRGVAAVAGNARRVSRPPMGSGKDCAAYPRVEVEEAPVRNSTGIEAFRFFICRTM